MPHETDMRYRLSSILKPATWWRLGLIGTLVFFPLVAFAWAGGFLSSGRLDQTHLINTFEAVNGRHPGFRRNHAKGICLTGWFDSNGRGATLSKALVFRPGRVPVFGRFALAGGMPRSPDNPATVRSMALAFALPDGEEWRTGMNDIPVFPVKDARGFYEQLVAAKPLPQTGKPDPAAVRAFLKAHPETLKAMALIKAQPFSSGFTNARYNSLNAFIFVSASEQMTPVRWSMVPVDRFAPEPLKRPQGKDYLFDDLMARLSHGTALWHLIVTVGQPGDPTDDATRPWPQTRERIDVGTLTVFAVAAEAMGNCRDTNFDPLVLPNGIRASDDPLLSARSAAYSVSFARRAGEMSVTADTGKGV